MTMVVVVVVGAGKVQVVVVVVVCGRGTVSLKGAGGVDRYFKLWPKQAMWGQRRRTERQTEQRAMLQTAQRRQRCIALPWETQHCRRAGHPP